MAVAAALHLVRAAWRLCQQPGNGGLAAVDAVPSLEIMGGLSNQWDAVVPAGSVMANAFTLTNDDGTPYSIGGLTWEYVVHADPADATPVISVTTTPNAQGSLTVTTSPTSQIALSLLHAATAVLPPAAYRHALWSNPGLPSALCWMQGSLTVARVAQP